MALDSIQLKTLAIELAAAMPPQEITEHVAPRAFAGWDSSIYLAWVRAMSDMMMSLGDPNTMDEHTLSNYGGLMHSLTEAAEELQERERAAVRKAA